MKALPIALALFLSLISHPAISQCIQDPREIALTYDSLQIRAYACRDDGVAIRAEFHRFGASTAGLLTSGGTSATLGKTIGSPRVLGNDVSAVLDDLFERFGDTVETGHTEPSLQIFVPGGGATFEPDKASGVAEIRRIPGHFEFPAMAEMKALDSGSVPPTLSVPPAGDQDFTHLPPGDVLWRYLTLEDVENYEAYREEYNRTFALQEFRFELFPNRTIAMIAHLAEPDGLPEDFDVVRGFRVSAEQADEAGGCMAAGWSFYILGRAVIMDALILENTSAAALTVGGLRGARSTGGLRPPPRATSGAETVVDLDVRLAPGERILIPTRIVFAPSDSLRPYSRTGYAFGPAFDVSGVVVDGRTIDFDERSANFMEISLFNEVGSCPYLLSWKEESQDWMQRGKILHAAQGPDKEYREVIEYSGFRNRFRLEEREPETAFIDQARLTVVTRNGTRHELRPDIPALADHDENRVVLIWGEAVEFDFSLPPEISASQVDRSELHVTGYYERYTAPSTAADKAGPDAASIDALPRFAANAMVCSPGVAAPVWPEAAPLSVSHWRVTQSLQ